MGNTTEIWQQACKRLRALLNEDTYDRWIAGIVPLAIDAKQCRLGVTNEVFSDWLNINYKDLISGTLTEVTGSVPSVTFETGHEAPPQAPAPRDDASARPAPSARKGKRDRNREADENLYNRRFTFDSFVVGDSSRFAHAAASAVAKSPGKTYNPLFIYGGTGLGKTHLLQAIAQEVMRRRKRPRVEYLSSEEFANAFIDGLTNNSLSKFRRRLRNLDLLLIDDVHFFKGKEQMQEEFFHTFNALYNGHSQIVLTSDRAPHEIAGLEKRLVSRFEWGLTTDILPPDLETRISATGLRAGWSGAKGVGAGRISRL